MRDFFRRRATLLLAMPTPIVLIVFAAILFSGHQGKDTIQSLYREAGRAAVASGDLDQGRFYYSRLIGDGDEGNPQDQLNWASMLAANGQVKAAIGQLDKLAPNDRVGFGPAHRQKAMMYISALQSRASGPEVLDQLHWHLRQGVREDSVEDHRLWTVYYLAVGQMDDAIDRMAKAATKNPDLWLDTAILCSSQGQTEAYQRNLTRAEEHARRMLDEDHLDVARRVLLARILVAKNEVAAAVKLLDDGAALKPDPRLQKAQSDICLVQLGQLGPDAPIADRVDLLAKAAMLGPANTSVYQLWSGLYSQLKSADDRRELRDKLEQMIVKGDMPAFAHFTLGEMFALDERIDDSIFHTEKAFELDGRLLEAANNLAWLLATRDNPDLKRAEELIRSCIEKRSGNPHFHDTLGTVLLKQERFDEAIVELERALPKMPREGLKGIHTRLAEAYRAVGKDSLAKLHADEAK